MVEVISEDKQVIDGGYCVIKQELSDGTRREITKDGDEISSIKTIRPDGSYTRVNGNNIKTSEQTPEGYWREYDAQTGKIKKEISPQKVITTFRENGNIESISDEANGIYHSYYENGNLARYVEKNYEIYKAIDGVVNYELKDGKLTINPDWFSYYRLGVKSQNNNEHWEEKCTLNSKKKTLLCLGGSQTKEARAANGNGNAFIKILGLSPEEQENVQIVSCYRPYNSLLHYMWRRVSGFEEQYKNDYKREILQKFLPFMARNVDGKFERLRPDELIENFGNIMIQTHCYGANDLLQFDKVFKGTMTKLGYSESLQKKALQQVICITNNSQREMIDNLSFTCIHRYSVRDGQIEPEYEKKYSTEYPQFVQSHEAFIAQKGNQSAFITTRPNEMIMVFDKILADKSSNDEHNDAFWTVNESILSKVGKYQARLMSKIGRFWYHNRGEMANVKEFVQRITANNTLHTFVTNALKFGEKLKAEKKNMLVNHHILKSKWNKFKNPNIPAPKTGVYKLLSEKCKS